MDGPLECALWSGSGIAGGLKMRCSLVLLSQHAVQRKENQQKIRMNNLTMGARPV